MYPSGPAQRLAGFRTPASLSCKLAGGPPTMHVIAAYRLRRLELASGTDAPAPAQAAQPRHPV